MSGTTFCFIFGLVLFATFLLGLWPALEIFDYFYKPKSYFQHDNYAWLFYILFFNGVILLTFGRYLASLIAYPYSSSFFRRNLERTTNEKFGEEFRRCVKRLVDIVE